MVTKPGYVSHQLHRSVDPNARYRFLNHGVWRSAEHWRAAHDQGFRALVSRPEWTPYTSTPALDDVVHAGSLADVVA
jgi:heme-degrading monooxygenase HmoA